MHDRIRPAKRLGLSAVATLALIAPLIAAPDAAVAATKTINLLNINDFHGRINDDTVAFAGTIEELRGAAGEANSLFLSAGDNIGASLFASASQDDQPTIDVLNALDLAASAVGNHEFDRGFEDLNVRVKSASDWAYLGANVYNKGTTTAAMDEYAIVDVAGFTVGIIGAVTQETPTLVAPDGIVNLDFGDPVEAVNRVANQLTDGNTANGEADILIAEYHEGAGAGAPDGATLAEEVAVGGAFASIVNNTSAKVAAIFTGHTHKEYAWDAPIPGGNGTTRPIVQTGSYGDNIGQILLNVEEDGSVVSYTAKNVQRTETDPTTLAATYPRVAEVKTIVDAALAEAAVVGSTPVGSLVADITTAFRDGTYGTDGYGGDAATRDDRGRESTLGSLVADALVESLGTEERGGAEIGVVNPGGLRNELYYAPDGVITYAEANAVLPFVNNLWTTTLTGAQFKTVLEQQWQLDADGNVPSRPYLQLGLSSNVSYTYDEMLPQGSRITSITVDGAPYNPAAEYRIGSFSFLLQGGDNFREFTNGSDTSDSGLIDREAWVEYLGNNPGLGPDFAERAVALTGVPTDVVLPGDAFVLDVSGLNLTSLGSPENTSITAYWDGVAGVSAQVNAGSATVLLTVPESTEAGTKLTLVASPSGTTVHVPITVGAVSPAPTEAPSSEATATPQPSPMVLSELEEGDSDSGAPETSSSDSGAPGTGDSGSGAPGTGNSGTDPAGSLAVTGVDVDTLPLFGVLLLLAGAGFLASRRRLTSASTEA